MNIYGFELVSSEKWHKKTCFQLCPHITVEAIAIPSSAITKIDLTLFERAAIAKDT
jgi:hypothetical protein